MAAGIGATTPRLLVTAGPTREPIDAVRYLSNRSSGMMGIAIASAAAERGWPTTILLGPVDVALVDSLRGPVPAPPTIHRFETTEELGTLLHRHWPTHDMLIMAAAVADHRPVLDGPEALRTKRRREGEFVLRLEPTPDLLAEIATLTRPNQITIGFALEPRDRLHASATEKLRRKRLRGIVANPLETVDAPTIDGVLLLEDGRVLTPTEHAGRCLDKPAFARWLLDRVAELGRGDAD